MKNFESKNWSFWPKLKTEIEPQNHGFNGSV